MKKRCFKCKKIKPLEEFYPHKQTADGYLNKCKLCTKKDVQERYDDPKNREKLQEYEKRREQDPHRKAKKLEYQRQRRAKSPGKNTARRKVTQALRAGRLVKLPCEVCGEAKSQAHHEDYRRYLQVTWLCFKHHREKHNQKVV